MDIDPAVLAGSVSTVVFIGSVMPMLAKAVRTRDLASYSLGNLLLANVGNLVHSVYVFSLPAGPIWALHGFHLSTTGFMLAMYVRHHTPAHRKGQEHDHRSDHHRPGDDRSGCRHPDDRRHRDGDPDLGLELELDPRLNHRRRVRR